MKLDIDKRERSSQIKTKLKTLFSETVEKIMYAGDYAFTVSGQRIGLSRKVIDGDFIGSQASGHTADEIRKMLETYDLSVMLLEGPQILDRMRYIVPGKDPMITYNRIDNALLTLQLAGVLVARSPAENRTPDRIASLVEYFSDEDHKSVKMVQRLDIPQILFNRDYNLTISAIMSLPGISQLLAERLLKHFRSLHKIWTAEIKELSQVEGIGPKKAKKIYDFIRKEWTDEELQG